MPWVTLPSMPKGLPTAMTDSPALTLSESPSVAGVSLSAGTLILSTARSLPASTPTTRRGDGRAVDSGTSIWSKPLMTWLLVRM